MTTLTNAKAFKGILQYKSTDNFTKETGYVYFIREFNENGEETGNAEIYFGNRKYGDVNASQLSEIESILETKLDSNNLKTINNESLVGDGNIVVGNIISEEDDSLTIDDVDTNTYVKYVAQTLTEEQKVQVRTNINALSENNIKTINGQSLIGSGDITISGGSSSGSSAYIERNHGTTDTTFILTPNTFHIWDEVSSLTLTLGAETSGVANEYIFQFTSGSEPTTLSLPDDIKWTGGETPTIEANKIYQISILKGLGSVLEWDNAPTLIENKATKSGYTLTFQYPVASDLTITQLAGDSTVISASNTTITLPTQSSISSITPSQDSTYKYTW